MAGLQAATDAAADFATATQSEWLSRIVKDQLFADFGLLEEFRRRVDTDRRRGGDLMIQPVNFNRNSKGGSYSGADPFTHGQVDTVRNSYWDFAKYQWSIEAQGDEVLRNQGSPEATFNMWTHKVDIAMESLMERLNTDLFGDGTGNGSKNLDGLGIAVDSAGTYGNISRSTFSAWGAKETAVGGGLAINGATGMNKMINDTALGSRAGVGIDAIWTTQDIVETYESLLNNDIRYMPMQKGDGGFSALSHKGIPLNWDRAATSGVMWFLKYNTFKTVIHPDRDFISTPVKKPENGLLDQDIWLSFILLMIQVLGLEPRRNGKLTGISG